MKAVYIAEPGGPEKLIYGDRPEPEAGPGEVVVRVRATALNQADFGIRSGRSSTGGLPHILGLDIAGEVADIGPGVEGWTAGDRVVVENRVKCGTCQPCVLGRDEFCERQKRLGGNLTAATRNIAQSPPPTYNNPSRSLRYPARPQGTRSLPSALQMRLRRPLGW